MAELKLLASETNSESLPQPFTMWVLTLSDDVGKSYTCRRHALSRFPLQVDDLPFGKASFLAAMQRLERIRLALPVIRVIRAQVNGFIRGAE